MPRKQVAGPTKPREKGHNGGGVEPGDVRAALETSAHRTPVAAARVMAEVKWQMPFDRQMDMDGPGEKRNHAQREAHEKTEEIKIRPGHRAPLTQRSIRLRLNFEAAPIRKNPCSLARCPCFCRGAVPP